jgi:hypothetical protein
LLDATKGIAVRLTDQAIDATLASNVDASFGTWVTDRGRGGATDLLVSIETVKATDADDVLVVTKLDPLRLAGADGAGGLATIDLAGQASGDQIDLSPSAAAMTVTVASGSAQLFASGRPSLSLTVTGAEQVIGSAFGDTMTSAGGGVVLDGGGGNDTLSTSGSGDTLNGGAGNDELKTTAAGTTLNGGDGNDRITVLVDLAGVNLDGGTGDDTLIGANGADIMKGDAGIDRLIGNGGRDTIFFDADDTFDGGLGADQFLYVGAGAERRLLTGEPGNDLYALGDHRGEVGYNFREAGDGANIFTNTVAFDNSRRFGLYLDDESFVREQWSLLVDVEETPTFVNGDSDLSHWTGFALIKLSHGTDAVSIQRVAMNFDTFGSISPFDAENVYGFQSYGVSLPDDGNFDWGPAASSDFASVTIVA